MRPSTVIYLLGLIASLGLLVLLVVRASQPPGSDDRPTLTFTAWGGAQETLELREQVIEPINERETRFRIELIPIPGDYATKLGTMIAGGTPPDLFYLSPEHVPALAGQGALLDLTDLLAADGSPVTDLDEYCPTVLASFRHHGRLYGLPWIAMPVIVYCNADLFDAADLTLPDGPWDRAGFIATARKLTRDTDGDGRIDQWGFILNGWPPWQMWVWQLGGDVVDRATGKLTLTDPAVAEGLDAYAGLIHREQVAPPLSVVNEMGFSDLFRAGRVAMFMGGAADDLDRLPGLRVVTAEVPRGPTGIRATFAYTAGLHVSSRTPDKTLAFEAFKQVLDGIQHWKIPSPRKRVAERLERIEPRKAPAAAVIKASMKYMRTPTVLPRQIEWDTLFGEEVLDPLLRKGTPAADLLKRARPRMEAWE